MSVVPGAQYVMGLDLGQTRNFTAMVVMERVWHAATAAEFLSSGTRGYTGEFRYTLVRADRVSLGTPYPRVVEWVKTVARSYGDQLMSIVVDASGVGMAVLDALRRVEIGVRLVGVVITGTGGTVTPGGYETVGRAELLTRLQMAVQGERFCLDRALRRELSMLGLDGSLVKRGRTQDDLAFALALAVWRGMRG